MIKHSDRRIIALLFWFLLLSPIAIAHSENTHDTPQDMRVQFSSCTNFLSISDRFDCYSSLCKPSYNCAEILLIATTEESGPKTGMQLLQELMKNKLFEIKSDGHELAHIIGRRTAKHFGMNGDASKQAFAAYDNELL